MSTNKKSNKQLKDPEVLAKQERKQKRIALASAKNKKQNQDFVIETNDLTTMRPKESKLKFTDLELALITYVKQLVTKYKNNEFTKITFRIKDFLDTIGTINNYQHIREAAIKIQDTQIIMKDLSNKNWIAYSSYFSTVITTETTSELTVTIDPEVLEHLGKQNKLFVTYRANIIYKLKGSYAKIMYPYLKAILGKSQRKNTTTRITIDELKELLSISENKYTRFADLNHKVLKSLVKEINSKTDIFIEYTPEKKGRATHKLFFEIRKQKQKPQNITEAMNNPATEELKNQGFNDHQTSKMLDLNAEFIPNDKYMAILNDYIYLDEDDFLLINEKLDRTKITLEEFKKVCIAANRYYKFKHQRKETNKFSSVNIFNKAIKERWDKKDPTDKEVNPQDPLELTLEQKVKEVAQNEQLHDDFTDFLFEINTDKAKSLMKSISKIGILQAYILEPHYFNLLEKFFKTRG